MAFAVIAGARTLVVETSLPTGVNVSISPADDFGMSQGMANLTLSYPHATEVALTAPNAVGRYRFLRWLKNGAAFESGLTARVRMDANHTLRALYQEVFPSFPTDLRIMPVGDSITLGYNGGNAGYRGPLYSLLNPLAPNFRFLGTCSDHPGTLPLQPINQQFHEGHPSYTIQDISNNLDGFDDTRFLQLGGTGRDPNGGFWLTGGNETGRAAIFPDIITLMAGTNDLAPDPGVEARLVGLLTKITTLRPATKLLVARITPIHFLTEDEDYNRIVSRVVGDFQNAGKNVHLVDLNTGFPVDGLDPDGVHPIDIGFNWMANRWFEAIVAAYSPAVLERPFRVGPASLPGTIEAEDFNFGGQGIAYSDATPPNEGGTYRADEGVDIQVSGDTGGGRQVFQTQAGEWLEYSITVNSTGGYIPSLRVASPAAGGEVFLEVDGIDVTNNVALPDTGGIANWETVTLPEIHLSAGEHVLRLVIAATAPGASAGAINWISFTSASQSGPWAQAGPNLETVDLNNNGSEPVTLNASGSIAGDSPSLTYTWWRGGTMIAIGINAAVNLPIGTQVIQLKVTDGNGREDTDVVLVTVAPKSLFNGSFESGFTGWTISGNLGIESTAPYSATDGVKLANFNGANLPATGVISQSLPTAVGGNYTLSFDAGVLSHSAAVQSLQVSATGSGELLAQTISISGFGGLTNRWLPQSFNFVANSPTTTLVFRDLSETTLGIDLLLDNVRVAGPPPFPLNTAPVAAGESYATRENVPLVVPAGGLLANDSDVNASPLVTVPNVLPKHGTLSMNLNGGFTYTPAHGYFGNDSFTYHASDQFLDSNIVTVRILVNEVIPAPVGAADLYSTDENTVLTVSTGGVLANDHDLRSRPLTAWIDAEPGHGSISFSPDGNFIYTPDAGFYGNDSFTYRCRNGFVDSDLVTVNLVIHEVIPPPVAQADSFVANENMPLRVTASGVLANDWDPRMREISAVLESGPGHGTLVLNPDGGFIYTPANYYFGPDSFIYRANNGFLDADAVIVNLDVKEVVPASLAAADSYVTQENVPLSVPGNGVLANDYDLRGRPQTAVLKTQPGHGTVVLNPNGSFLYTPAAGYHGTDSFTYLANNGFLDSNTVAVNLSVTEVIPPPVAVADAFVTDENNPLLVPASGVLANDADPRGRPLTAILVTGPRHGTLVFKSDGGFTYTPANYYFGPDSFTYRANNGIQNSGVVSVDLAVNEVVPAPLAAADSYSTQENVPLSVPANGVLANDYDLRGRPRTAVLKTQPGHGTVVLNPNGSFLYTPAAGYYGTDSFTYLANNGFLDSNTVAVKLNVQEIIPPPVAMADSFVTDENIRLMVPAKGVLSNDADPRGRPLTATLATGPRYGRLVFKADGGFAYIPTVGYFGTDSFTYRSNNGFLKSNLVTVGLTVNEVIPPPVAVADSFVTNESVPLVIPASGVLANDSDPRGRPLTAILKTGPGHGALALNPDGSFTYTPAAGYFGPDAFTYQTNNGFLDSNTVTVDLTVNEVIPPPVAVADSYFTAEGIPLAVPARGVLANDSDPRGRPLTALLKSGPAHGVLSLNPDGGFVYTPVAGFFGADSFTYQTRNGVLDSNISTVSITVDEVIPAPVAVADAFVTNESVPLVIPASGVLANDSDPRGRRLTAILKTGPGHGALALTPDGSFTYTPAAGYFGPDSFTYQANNGFMDSNTVTVNLTVNEVVPPPVAVADTYFTTEGTPLVVPAKGVLANDSDPRGRPLTASVKTGPAHGSLILNPDGGFTYTPVAGYFGTDSFTYQISNGILASNVSTVSITVDENVPAPVAVADSYPATENTALVIPASGVLANDSDPRARPLTAVLEAGPSHGTLVLNPNGAFTYTPAAGFSGTDSFTYHARNGFVNSNSVTVTINVEEIYFKGLVNGSFESGFTGWTTAGNQDIQSAAPYAATDGTKLVAFNGDNHTPNAVLSQTFFTAAGATYTLAFDLGVLSYNTNPQTMQVSVNGTGNLLLRTVSVTGLGGGTNRWVPQSFTFVANSPLTTLTFRDQSTSTLALDMLLDNVRVTGPPVVVNTAPVAVADSYSTNQNTALVVPAAGVLANDTDAQFQALTAVLAAGPAHGTLVLNANGSFAYTPAAGFTGADSFTYRASDGSLSSGIATVNLTVNEVIAAPVAVSDSYSTDEGKTLLVIPSGGVLANDTDPASRTLTAVLDAGPSHGTLTLNPDGSFTYTPATGYFGADSFTYHANNGFLSSNVVTVGLTVNPVVTGAFVNGSFESGFTGWTTSGNQSIVSGEPFTPTDGVKMVHFNGADFAPNAVLSQTFATVAGQTYTLAFDLGVIAYNTNSQTMQVTVTGTNNLLTRTINLFGSGGGKTLWAPQSFTFVANSSSSTLTFRDQSSSTLAIDLLLDNVRITGGSTPPNTAPVAVADSYSTTYNTALVVPASGILANDSDAQSQPLSAVLVAAPVRGTLVLNPGGGFSYSPNTGFYGTDSFTYKANDGLLDSNIVSVNITVAAPVAVGLVNGSFESGFTGWTTTGNQEIQSAAPYAATHGTKLVGFNGANLAPNAVLSQTFATSPGQTCSLTFDAGVFAYNTNSQTLQVTVSGSGTLLNRTITLFGAGGGTNRWQAQSFTFVTDSTSTILTFRDQSTSSLALDLLLDNVRVSAAAAPLFVNTTGLVNTLAAQGGELGPLALTGTPGDFTIRMTAIRPGSYILERSKDLRVWERIREMEVTEPGPIEFRDTLDPPGSQAPEPRMFYRVGRLPDVVGQP